MKRAKILSASAGSGKTYQLAYKYVRDVIEHPELYRAILAVTFTNKATEEMKSRILREIHILASGAKSNYMSDLRAELQLGESQVRERAKKARTFILHDYSRFSVLTIDRFFQRIIRAFIKELGIDLNYNIELDPNTLLKRSADGLVESIAESHDLRRWLLEFAEERIAEGDRWDMRGDLSALGRELFKEKTRERMEMKHSKEELSEIVNRLVGRSERCKNRMKALAESAIGLMAERGVSPAEFKGSSRSFVFNFQRYAAGEFREPSATMYKAAEDIDAWYGKTADARVKDAATELMPILKEMCDLYNNSLSVINTASIVRENYRSFALLADLYDKVTQMCEEENIMILGETKNILSTFINDSNAPFIYEKVGNRYERYMIDEFQDTSVREWKNLLPLLQNAMAQAEDVSVLIVGDVKQSIYRWRGGDWRLLKSEAVEALGKESTITEPLTHNYRSLRSVVEFNNKTIECVVEKDGAYLNTMLDQALSNKEITPALHSSLYNIMNSAYADHNQKSGSRSSEDGYAEVTIYDSERGFSPFIQTIEDVISRGYRYRDILILVRGANDGRKVAEELFAYKEKKFTSQGEVGFNILTQDALTIDSCDIIEFIIAVMRLSIDAGDDIERGVYNRYLGYDLGHRFSDEELAYLSHIAHLSPMEALESIISNFRLNEKRERIAYLQAIHEQVIAFSTSRIADIRHYLDWWDERGKSETLRVEMSDDTIEIMTIHKAKGLERKVVIIPNCKWDTAPRGNLNQVIWAQADDRSDIATIGEFPVIYRKTMQQSAFTEDYYKELTMSHIDAVNLLYVALTRASEELYVFTPQRLNAKSLSDDITTIVPLMVDAASKVCGEGVTLSDEEGIKQITYSCGRKVTSNTSTQNANVANDHLLEEYTSHRPSVSIHLPGRRYSDEGLSVGSSSRINGIRLHRIFEQSHSIEDIDRAIKRLERDCLIDSNEAMQLSESIAKAMTDPTVREWFTTDWEDVKCEAGIITPQNMRRPDRVMIKGRRAVVVDYKFGQNEERSYLKQMREYLDLLDTMERYDSIEGYVWYIALGKVVKA